MSETDPYTVLHKMVDTAYRLGQIYWQQADSEYASQHKKADETNKKFLALRVEAANAVNELERECSELRAKLAECERQEPVAVCVAVNEWTTEPRYVYPADDKNPPAGTKLYAHPLAR